MSTDKNVPVVTTIRSHEIAALKYHANIKNISAFAGLDDELRILLNPLTFRQAYS
jgi:hypothetical protein